MKILLVKMSSMGDVFHTLPALSDVLQHYPDLQVDWIVESDFATIPTWHLAVNKVYPIELRKWRKRPWFYRNEIKTFFNIVNQQKYDFVIDAQGLLKSAWVVKKIKAKKIGMDWKTIREPIASLFYDIKFNIPKNLHAIERLRMLFAEALNFPYDATSQIKYYLQLEDFAIWKNIKATAKKDNIIISENDYVVCLHGTTWDTKLWPEDYWVKIAQYILPKVSSLVLPWGTEDELTRSKSIYNSLSSQERKRVWIPQVKLSLEEMAFMLKNSKQVIAVDTGLSHVAAALEVPTLVLYRVTDPKKIGAKGMNTRYLQSPLAKKYLKKFSNNQEKLSLEGLSVLEVKSMLSDSLGV